MSKIAWFREYNSKEEIYALINGRDIIICHREVTWIRKVSKS